jgi:hypothetical protein
MQHALNVVNARSDTLAPRPIGRLLLDGEFVHGSDLAQALAAQRSTNQQLGQILVKLGRLDPADLTAVLTIQQYTSRLDDALKLAAGIRQRLGELLLAARWITPDQLYDALKAQQQSGKPLGEILIDRKLLETRELDILLEFQRNQAIAGDVVKPLHLGEILVVTGKITRQQLDEALTRQQHTHRKLGELLIEAGHLLRSGLSEALHLQQKLVVAALIAVLSLGALTLAQPVSAAEGSGPISVNRHLDLKIVIPDALNLKVLNQMRTLNVTLEDVARGYVDVVAGTNMEIVSTIRSGFQLQFRFRVPDFREAEVHGLHEDIVVGAEGASLANHEGRGLRARYELNYRFKVPADMHAGVYPWPLQISASHL